MTEPGAYDVAIIGGGPAGSSLGSLLKKYAPGLSVLILEREKFPRDHVGESLLPVVSRIVSNMGCWDEIEAADFPVKIGATYRWGLSRDLWDFDFLAGQTYEDAPRPAPFHGQRKSTAFQVDRSIFDDILLRHAATNGVDVRLEVKVSEVLSDGDAVTGLRLEDGSHVTARYFVDASGHSGILRRALGVEIEEPSALKNIAIWRYWQDAEWAVSIGASGTRIQIWSLGWGWIWIIPISPTRTSIGLVVPAEYYKKSGKRPQDLYDEALSIESNVRVLLTNATAENELHTTKDWSFISSRMAGKNWFLVGEAAGFADPILSAGVSMAMVGGQEAAITIAELERGAHEATWLKQEFEKSQARRIKAHIQFADYWYTANTHFTDLIEYIGDIANESGLTLKGQDAWQWLGTGGFVQMGGPGVAGFGLASTKWLVDAFHDSTYEWRIAKNNLFTLDLTEASKSDIAVFHEGYVESIPALVRGTRVLPARGVYRFLVQALTQTNRVDELMRKVSEEWCRTPEAGQYGQKLAIEALEAMINDGWVAASYTPDLPLLDVDRLAKSTIFYKNTDNLGIK